MHRSITDVDLIHRGGADEKYFSVHLRRPGSAKGGTCRHLTIKIHKITVWLLVNMLLWAGLIDLIYQILE